jgi:small subunit ribosomal protein S17
VSETENQNSEEHAGEIPQEAEAVEAAVEPGEAEPLPEEVPAEAAGEPPTPEAEAAEAPPAEAPAAEAPAAEAPAEEAAEDAAPAEEAPPQPAAEKKKRKRVPRSERRQRSRPKREQPAERKPITRLPKPVSERGRRQERRGVVVSSAMDKTIVVKVDTVKAHTRYKKVVRRSVKFQAHDPENQANVGDIVRIVETRPISKTKNWRLAEIVEAAR